MGRGGEEEGQDLSAYLLLLLSKTKQGEIKTGQITISNPPPPQKKRREGDAPKKFYFTPIFVSVLSGGFFWNFFFNLCESPRFFFRDAYKCIADQIEGEAKRFKEKKKPLSSLLLVSGQDLKTSFISDGNTHTPRHTDFMCAQDVSEIPDIT